MNKHRFYIANWKMYWTFDETVAFATKNYDTLTALAATPNTTLVLCPSAPALYPLSHMFKETNVVIGAQDCSDHRSGAFTGQISAAHLQSADCSYCIVGHSERRSYNNETNDAVARKCEQLLQAEITPVICIGETAEENKQGKTLQVLESQLSQILSLLKNKASTLNNLTIVLAYEPLWAIGSSLIPTPEHLETVFAWLSTITHKAIPSIHWALLYGGSVTSTTVAQLKQITAIEGFLIGGASLDFQELEKIVKYTIKEPK